MHHFLRRVNFYRKGKQSHLSDIVTFIQCELEGTGSCRSYRVMHQRCIRNGLMESRVIVAQVMKHLNSIVNTRRRRTLRCQLYTAWVQIGFDIWIDMTSRSPMILKRMIAWMDIAGMFYG